MKTLTAAALATALTVATMAAGTGTASAGGWNHGNNGNAAGAFAIGTAIGLGLGVLAAQPREVPAPVYVAPPAYPTYEALPAYPTYEAPRYVRQASWSDHVDYCLDRHPGYDPRSDTYINRYGEVRRCYGSY